MSPVYVVIIISLFVVILGYLQLAFTNIVDYTFGDYISEVYNSKSSPAGILVGMLVYGLALILNNIGAYIVLSIFGVILIAMIIDQQIKMQDYHQLNSRMMSYKLTETSTRVKTPINVVADSNVENVDTVVAEQALTLNARLEALKKEREERIMNDPLNIANKYNAKQSNDIGNDELAKKIFGEDFINSVKRTSKNANVNLASNDKTINDLMQHNREVRTEPNNIFVNANNRPKQFLHENDMNYSGMKFDEPKDVMSSSNLGQMNNNKWYDDEDDMPQRPAERPIPITPNRPMPNYQFAQNNMQQTHNTMGYGAEINSVPLNRQKNNNSQEQMEMQQLKPTPNRVTPYTKPSPYIKPPVELLTTKSMKLSDEGEDYQIKANMLEATLDSFRIPAKVVAITHGPAVTRYELQMPAGIPVNKIRSHADDIAMNLSSNGGIRIEAPIPGKNLVGIEVPNQKVATIGLRDVIDSPEFHSCKDPLVFALGKNISGEIKVCDLASMPHLLVAGSSGSGKSVCLNVLLLSLLYKMGPEDLKLILIDPKRVEFTSYNGIPHLLTPTAINQPKQALNALDWAVMEMDNRYSLFQRMRVRDFKEYNSLESVYKGREPKLPRIVVIIDELADLMMLAKKEIEDKIMRLAQLARAAGIHLVIATQRPSVDVITGTIKANLPSRIAFAVTNFADSKTILDQGGADKLLGRGDMLYAPQNLPEPVRIQCPFVTNSEVINIVEYIKNKNPAYFDEELTKKILSGAKQSNGTQDNSGDDGEEGIEFDPLLPMVLKEFIMAKTGSISSIQRRHSVGFNRAARIMDQMEQAGFVSPSDGSSKNRTILITLDQYEERFGSD